MAKKKETVISYNPNWEVSFEYQHGKDLIVKGTEIRFKYARGTYKFEKYVKNTATGTEWIDTVGPEGYKSFYLGDLKGIIKPKKKRVKKNA